MPGVDDPMQIRFHQLSDDVDIGEACFGLRAKQIGQQDYVFVLEEFFMIMEKYSAVLSI